MPAPDDCHELVFHPRFGGESGAHRRRADHAELHKTRDDPLLDFARVPNTERERDLRVRLMKSSQDFGKEVGARGRARAYRHGSRPQSPQLDRRVLGARYQTERLANERLDEAGGGGWPDPAAGPLEQRHAEERLEPAQVLRHRRLADAARLGGATYAA